MTIPLTIKQIEMLVKISEGKGLSEAARLLNLSPSAVSKGLAVMEENLGVPLIQRTTRSFLHYVCWDTKSDEHRL